MSRLTPKLLCCSFAMVVCAFVTRADSLTNDFATASDYIANGILGDTNWDGVYLGFGDIPNGNAGGSGNGSTLIANTTVFGGGFLGVRSMGGDWSDSRDDGFFIYKVVRGDLDVSVESTPLRLDGTPTYDARPFHFGGLMVRAYHTNNFGTPFSTTLTNAAENFLLLWRFNEFGIDAEVRNSTNGVNQEYIYNLLDYYDTNTVPAVTNATSDTDSARGFRIVRRGTGFSFYTRRFEYGDTPGPWLLITNLSFGLDLVRDDWNGIPLQVGIAQAPFSTDARDAVFANFELSGPNVTFPALPTPPADLVVTATNSVGSITFSWTLGTPGDNSLVVMSQRPVQHTPVNGMTYKSSPVYGDGSALLGGANEYVVYNGPGTSVTVSNLAASALYSVAVFEYSGSGTSSVYNTASPLTNPIIGPPPNNVDLQVPTSEIPVNGAVKLRLLAIGSSISDVSSKTTWSSDDPSIAAVDSVGTVTGVAEGSTTLRGVYGTFNVSTPMSVHASVAFADNFLATNDYVANHLIGSAWDGLYLDYGDVPGGAQGGDGAGMTVALNSQINSTNGLYVSSTESDWEGANDDGPFLFKIVPGRANAVSGDFQAIVHVDSMDPLYFEAVGLMARIYSQDGGPGPGAAENHVNYWKVQNGTTSVRCTQNGVNNPIAEGPSAADAWLLLQRANSTNFCFFERSATNLSWIFVTNVVLDAAAGDVPMQVGIAQQTLSGVIGVGVVNDFMLDAAGIITPFTPPPPPTGLGVIRHLDYSITLSYSVGTNSDGTAIGSVAVMHAGGPVTAQPYTGMDLPGNPAFGDPNNDLGSGNFVVYRSPDGSLQTHASVTVSNLAPGTSHCAAVYTFVGSGTTRTFNVIDGAHQCPIWGPPPPGIAVIVPPIPLNGIGVIQVLERRPGQPDVPIVIRPTNPVITSGDTNVVKVLDGIATGVGLGTTTLTVVSSGVTVSSTQVCTVTVHAPTFTDSFGTSHDYLQDGVAGALFDGIYDVSGSYPIPGSTYVPPPGSGTLVADANITGNHLLTITGTGDGWENNASGGFFLFKYVPGDFQMAVHIHDFTRTNYNQPGLLARAYAATNAVLGQPLGYEVPNSNGTNDTSEYWVSLVRFDEFGIGTYARLNTNAAVHQDVQPDQGDTNNWLLIVRSRGTNFSFYKKLNLTDPWRTLPLKTVYHVPQVAGRPMQVGLMAGDWNLATSPPNTVSFDTFMLDVTTSELSIQVSDNGDGSVTVSWPADPNSELQSSASLDPWNWQPVGGMPVLGNNGRYNLSVPMAAGKQYFRVREGMPITNSAGSTWITPSLHRNLRTKQSSKDQRKPSGTVSLQVD